MSHLLWIIGGEGDESGHVEHNVQTLELGKHAGLPREVSLTVQPAQKPLKPLQLDTITCRQEGRHQSLRGTSIGHLEPRVCVIPYQGLEGTDQKGQVHVHCRKSLPLSVAPA